MVNTMYQYEDPPEVQSPEQRSVVFASMANLFTFLTLALLCQNWITLRLKNLDEFWFAVVVPTLMSIIILHLGRLWITWPWLARLVGMALLSVMMLVGMVIWLLCAIVTVLFVFSKMWDEIDWQTHYR